MPTGYTAPIEDGTITEVKDYAALCARAFGAFVHQRDESLSGNTLRYPDAPDTSYYAKNLASSKDSLSKWQNSTEEEKYAEWSEYYKKALISKAESIARTAQEHSRYQTMLAQIHAIDVPSQLENFKNFMIEQIELSDRHNGGDDFASRYYGPMEYGEWCDSQSEHRLRSVVNAEKYLSDEIKRYNDRVDFINVMVETFGFEVSD